MWFSVLLALLSANAAPAQGPPTVEPVYDLAVEDLRALNRARAAQVVCVAMPGLLIAGTFVSVKVRNGDGRLNGRESLPLTLLLVGGVGMIAAPAYFQGYTGRSRRFLRRQGLRVPRTPPVVVPLLAVTSVLMVSVTVVRTQDDDLKVGSLLAGLAVYGGAVGLPTVQLALNRRARDNAGWLGVTPMLGEAQGVQVAGRW